MTFETVIIYRFKSYDIWYMYDSGNNVIGFEYSQLSEINETLKTTRIYYEKNLQGDVTGLLDARGAKIASYTYDAWGNVITDTEKSFCYEGYEVPFELNHVLYRGYYYDGSCTDTESDTNLYYLQSRYYDAEVGRFINADDTNMLELQLNSMFKDNLYCYCSSNPVNNVDCNGLFGTPIQWAMATIGAVAGWVLGDYVVRYFGYKKGIKYWAIRAGIGVGGAVIGWFAGTALLKAVTTFIYTHPNIMKRMPRFVLWLLGINKTTSEFTELFDRYATHIFSKAHIRDGIMKLGYSKRNIFDKGINIIQGKMVQAVNGSNEVRTTINGIKVTIRFYLSDGKIRSMDMLVGWSSRVIGKLLK